MLIKITEEDNRTPPGFAVVVVHHRPHQLNATLVCRSVRAKLYRLQLLAHAYQQPASDVQVHHQQPNAQAQSLHNQMLAVNIKFDDYRKEEKDAHTSLCAEVMYLVNSISLLWPVPFQITVNKTQRQADNG